MSLQQPKFILMYKGIDVSDEINPMLISLTYTDHLHGKTNEIEVKVQDKDGLWKGEWKPEKKDKCEAKIGYQNSQMVDCGEFEIDEPEVTGNRQGDYMTFRAQSAGVSKAVRTKKTRAFEKQTAKQIVTKVAEENGLEVEGNAPEVSFERKTQRRESDLGFVKRVAEEYGAYTNVVGKKLVFTQRDDIRGRAPVRTITLQDKEQRILTDYTLKDASTGTYSKVKLSYFDKNRKRTIDVEEADLSVSTGDTLKLDARVENQDQAQKRAKAELAKKNDEKGTGSLTLVGDPTLVAGQTIILAGFGKYDGKFVIDSSRHELTRTSYTTSLEIKRVK